MLGITSIERPLQIRNLIHGQWVSFPFTSEDDYRSLGLGHDHLFGPQVALQNPLSERFGFLPTTLVPCLLRAAQNSRARGDFGGLIFEVERGFFGSSKDFAQKKGFESWKSLTSPSSHISHKGCEEMSRPQKTIHHQLKDKGRLAFPLPQASKILCMELFPTHRDSDQP